MRVLLILLVLALVAAGSSFAAGPTLRVVDQSPLVVRGSGFTPAEKVRVWLALTSSRRFRDVVAGARGGFTARFTVTPAQCSYVRSLSAVGNHGSRTARPLRLDCMPPPPLAASPIDRQL